MMDIRLSFQYSSLRETEEYVEFDVVAITASVINRPFGKIEFPEEILKASAHTLIGKPLLIDHRYSVEAIVGTVVDAKYSEEKKGIVATVKIPKAGHEKLIGLIKMEPSPIKNVSVGVVVETEDKNGLQRVIKAEFKELSLVIEGADPNATRLSSQDTSHWWDDPDLRQKAPRDYFLDPSSRRYPYKTWEGEISCERLKAAMSLAGLHGHRQIYDRAKALYERHCKKEGAND
jgi:hypothetical protein